MTRASILNIRIIGLLLPNNPPVRNPSAPATLNAQSQICLRVIGAAGSRAEQSRTQRRADHSDGPSRHGFTRPMRRHRQGVPLLIWLDGPTCAAFRTAAWEQRIPLEQLIAVHLAERGV